MVNAISQVFMNFRSDGIWKVQKHSNRLSSGPFSKHFISSIVLLFSLSVDGCSVPAFFHTWRIDLSLPVFIIQKYTRVKTRARFRFLHGYEISCNYRFICQSPKKIFLMELIWYSLTPQERRYDSTCALRVSPSYAFNPFSTAWILAIFRLDKP